MEVPKFFNSAQASNHSRIVTEYVHKFHITPSLWPLGSPDLHPLDYFAWCVVKKNINRDLHNTKNSLKASIVKGNGQH